jgi:hypothetical protein
MSHRHHFRSRKISARLLKVDEGCEETILVGDDPQHVDSPHAGEEKDCFGDCHGHYGVALADAVDGGGRGISSTLQRSRVCGARKRG